MLKLNIATILKEQNKSQYWLAKKTGISPNNVGKMCNGETTNIRLDTMDKICTALHCTPNDILIINNKKDE